MAEQGTRDELSSFNELLQCTICFEPFTNPKMLQCGHPFCEECLRGHHNANQQERRCPSGNLPCPTCREITRIPVNGIAGLRNDFRMNKIEDLFRKTIIRNRASSNQCNPCMSKNMSVIAKVYCVSCNVNYCEGCLQTHNTNPIFKDHTVVDKTALQNSVSTMLTCKIHKGEESRYFCRTCKTAVCTLCIIEDHGEHDVVITEVAYKQQLEAASELKQSIHDKVTHQRVVKVDLEAVHSSVLRSCEQAESGINERASQMIASIEKQKTYLLRQLHQKLDQKLVPLMRQLETVDCYIAKAESLQDLLTTSETATQVQFLAGHDDLMKNMLTITKDDQVMRCDKTSLTMAFLAGNQDPIVGRIDAIEGCVYSLGAVNPVAQTKDEIDRHLTESMGSGSGGSTPRSYVIGGSTVEVVRGDLTTLSVDAIVSTANRRLDYVGRHAKAILVAGGPEIQWECRAYVQQHGSLNLGQVYVSTSGQLPCKKVIHAVGSKWKGGHNNEKNTLSDAVYESMLAAEQCGLSSIALSSGALGFPIDVSTKIIVSAVKEFLESDKQSCVKKVLLVDPVDHVVKSFHKCLGVMAGM